MCWALNWSVLLNPPLQLLSWSLSVWQEAFIHWALDAVKACATEMIIIVADTLLLSKIVDLKELFKEVFISAYTHTLAGTVHPTNTKVLTLRSNYNSITRYIHFIVQMHLQYNIHTCREFDSNCWVITCAINYHLWDVYIIECKTSPFIIHPPCMDVNSQRNEWMPGRWHSCKVDNSHFIVFMNTPIHSSLSGIFAHCETNKSKKIVKHCTLSSYCPIFGIIQIGDLYCIHWYAIFSGVSAIIHSNMGIFCKPSRLLLIHHYAHREGVERDFPSLFEKSITPFTHPFGWASLELCCCKHVQMAL